MLRNHDCDYPRICIDSTPEEYPEICHEKHPCKLLCQQKPFDRGNGSILPHNGIIYI